MGGSGLDDEAPRGDAVGTHLLAELDGCDRRRLDDPEAIRAGLLKAAAAAGATVVGCTVHRFSPQGVSGVAVLAESHLSIHTWPELGYAAVDIFSCASGCRPERAIEALAAELAAAERRVVEVPRGPRARRGRMPGAEPLSAVATGAD